MKPQFCSSGAKQSKSSKNRRIPTKKSNSISSTQFSHVGEKYNKKPQVLNNNKSFDTTIISNTTDFKNFYESADNNKMGQTQKIWLPLPPKNQNLQKEKIVRRITKPKVQSAVTQKDIAP